MSSKLCMAMIAAMMLATTGCKGNDDGTVTTRTTSTVSELDGEARGETTSLVGDQDEATRSITLTKGDTLSYNVGTDGSVDITVEILPGKPGAGIYRSTNAELLETAAAAQSALNEPNTEVGVRVNGADEIVSVWYETTL